ncbi:MAG TPA: Rieske (2Fe-2S) protein [Candidatus Polarisedimenticolaceae bacterium]|nr:Rieske (2Fe-2S) protein [Candidatus Polarisedimenticolaceae bacterium]
MRVDDPETVSAAPDGRPAEAQPRWRRDFPVDGPADEFRSRREFTGLLLLTSLAFAAGQLWIVGLRAFKGAHGSSPVLDVAGVDELPPGGMKVFEYPTKADPCVLVRLADGSFVAYDRRCTHLSCPVIPRPAAGRLDCPCHNGHFDLATGAPLAGPPRRPLPRVTLEIRRGRIVATGLSVEGGRRAEAS